MEELYSLFRNADSMHKQQRWKGKMEKFLIVLVSKPPNTLAQKKTVSGI